MSSYPLVIPEVVIDRLRRYFRIEPAEVLNRKAARFGGKSAIEFVADGDGSWDDVLAVYDDLVGSTHSCDLEAGHTHNGQPHHCPLCHSTWRDPRPGIVTPPEDQHSQAREGIAPPER